MYSPEEASSMTAFSLMIPTGISVYATTMTRYHCEAFAAGPGLRRAFFGVGALSSAGTEGLGVRRRCKGSALSVPPRPLCRLVRPMCALRDDDGEEDVAPPRLQTDWRSFRARLVSLESAQNVSSDEERAGKGVVDGKLAQIYETPRHYAPPEWAHPVSHVEAGCVLIANPAHFVGSSAVSFFANTVVFVLDHCTTGLSGSVGVIVNRPVASSLSEMRTREDSKLGQTLKTHSAFRDSALFCGGPVALENLLVLHNNDDAEGSLEIIKGVHTGGLQSVVKAVTSGAMDVSRAKFVAGYSGWGGGQLAEEIEDGVWLTCACNAELILEHRVNSSEPLSKRLLKLMGGPYLEIAERVRESEDGYSFEI